MMKKWLLLASVPVVVASLATATVLAADIGGTDMMEKQGTISSVDASNGSLQVQWSSGEEAALRVAKDAQIRLGDRPISLDAIPRAGQATVRFDPNTMAVESVTLRPVATVEGYLMRYDPATGDAMLALPVGATLPLKLTAGTRLERMDTGAALNQPMVGQRAVVQFDAKSGEALAMKVETQRAISAQLTAVEPEIGRITLRGPDGAMTSLVLADGVKVDVRKLLLAYLLQNPGVNIQATYDTATGAATELSFR